MTVRGRMRTDRRTSPLLWPPRPLFHSHCKYQMYEKSCFTVPDPAAAAAASPHTKVQSAQADPSYFRGRFEGMPSPIHCIALSSSVQRTRRVSIRAGLNGKRGQPAMPSRGKITLNRTKGCVNPTPGHIPFNWVSRVPRNRPSRSSKTW